MSTVHQCDRCGAQTTDPKTEGWVTHYVASPTFFGRIFNEVTNEALSRNDEMCRSCREAYEDWMKVPLDE